MLIMRKDLEAALARVSHPMKGTPTPAQAESGNYAKRTVPWRGLSIAIENEAGSVRSGVSPKGESWQTRIHYPYGYVKRSTAIGDGEEVDCYLGPDLEAAMVYVIHQRRYGDWSKYDEDKCMIGFGSEDEAVAGYLANYNDPRFLGPVTAMPVDEFVAKVKATKERPAMIKSFLVFMKSLVRGHDRTAGVRKIHVDPYFRKEAAGASRQPDLFEAPVAATIPGPVVAIRKESMTPAMAEMMAHHSARAAEAMEDDARIDAARQRERDQLAARTREIDAEREANEAAYRAESARIDAEPVPEGHHRGFYVTMKDGPRTAWLAGPFDRHEHARAHVDRSREKAIELDHWNHFHAFGTSSITRKKELALPHGKINHLLDLPSGGGTLLKSLFDAPVVVFLKAHVDGYTKNDGTVVQAHEDRRTAHTADHDPADHMSHEEFNAERAKHGIPPISAEDWEKAKAKRAHDAGVIAEARAEPHRRQDRQDRNSKIYAIRIQREGRGDNDSSAAAARAARSRRK